MPAPLLMHCSWHYTIKISDKRHLLLLWRLVHYFISAFTVPWHLFIRLHFYFLLALKKNAQDKRRVNPAPQLPAPRFECNHIWMQTRPSCVPLYLSEWLAITCLCLWINCGLEARKYPPLLFLALFTSLCDYIMTKGRGKMKRTNMLRRTRWNTNLGHRKRLFSNLTFPHTTCCLLHCFLEVRLNEGCLKDGKRQYRFVPTSERDEVET